LYQKSAVARFSGQSQYNTYPVLNQRTNFSGGAEILLEDHGYINFQAFFQAVALDPGVPSNPSEPSII
jgi:hypothetical protein